MLDALNVLIEFHLRFPETVKPTLTRHIPDNQGHCTGCISPNRARTDRCIFREAAGEAAHRLGYQVMGHLLVLAGRAG